jgi:uncharacterized protein YjbJ (UPF0337 family)
MAWNEIEGNWKQFTGKVQEKWGKLTNDDMDVIEGKKDHLVGKIQEAYGRTQREAQQEVDDWERSL